MKARLGEREADLRRYRASLKARAKNTPGGCKKGKGQRKIILFRGGMGYQEGVETQ
jgi:hypothetical protein